MSNWTRAQTLELISLYEQHPILYNIKCEEFLDRLKKNDALAEISTALMSLRSEVTPDEVKSKIKTIRSQYIREKNAVVKSKKSGAGADDVYVPKLWCFEELQFMDKHIASTPQYSNISKPFDDCSTTSSGTSLLADETDLSNDNICGRRKRTALDKQISRSLQIAEDMAESARIRREKKPSPQYNLGKFVENELEGISESLFIEAKWKIVNILQDTQEKDFRFKASLSENFFPPNLSGNPTSETLQSSSSCYPSSPATSPVCEVFEINKFPKVIDTLQDTKRTLYASRQNASHPEAVVPAKVMKSSIADSEMLQSAFHEPFHSSIRQRRPIQTVGKISKSKQISATSVAHNSRFVMKSIDNSQNITASEELLGTEHSDKVFKPVHCSSPITKAKTFFIKNVKPQIFNVDKASPTLTYLASSPPVVSDQVFTNDDLDTLLNPVQRSFVKSEKAQILNVKIIHNSNTKISSAFQEPNKK